MTSPPVPDLLTEWKHAVLASSGGGPADDAAIAGIVDAQRTRVAGLRDPFTPLARGDAAARAKEVVLWEDDALMVIVDTFAPPPKALVIPKAPVSFPIDLAPALLDRLAMVGSVVGVAFSHVAGCGPARCWINPPYGLTVRQLHVHVLPGRMTKTLPGADLHAQVTSELIRQLGAPR